jgi:AraC-like DNA-binding protein
MDSLFFNITDTRYKITPIYQEKQNHIERVDISNGIVFFEGNLRNRSHIFDLENLDRMVMIVMVNRGRIMLHDRIGERSFRVDEGQTAIYVSSRQKMQMVCEEVPHSEIFILFIADFFLKRYLSGNASEPLDLLYTKIQDDVSLEEVNLLPVDALSLYIVEKLLNVQDEERMQSIRAEHRVVEFMIHRFSLIDVLPEGSSEEEKQLAAHAREILLAEFIDPPTIEILAHRCATNASKLKKVFKKTYGTTIYQYVQKLRLEEANLLLRKEHVSIGEIAKRVGYRHQGHFSKLFYAAYGVYPRELQQH